MSAPTLTQLSGEPLDVKVELDEANGPRVEEGNDPTDRSAAAEVGAESDIQYKVWENPPVYMCALLGLQHYVTMFMATLTIPFLLAPVICLEGDNVGKAHIIGTLFVASGIITVLQNLVGVRLPIVQAGTFAIMAPTLAFFNQPQWACPAIGTAAGVNETSMANMTMIEVGSAEHREVWMYRLRVIQGSLMVAAVFEFLLGVTGAVGLLLRFIGPLTICPTISMLGLSLFKSAARYAAHQWWICLATVLLMVIFSQYMGGISIPCLSYTKSKGFHTRGYPILRMFPVILAILIGWFLCFVLTVTDVLPRTEGEWGYGARTDTKSSVIYDSPWFRFPYPGQWGMPIVSLSCVVGLLSGVIATTVESVGDYHACARLSGAPPPPMHAINRGIMIEGFGTFLDACLGTGNGTTSTSINVGVIGITKVGSRRVVLYCAAFMICLGVFNKFGALFITVPDPVIGASFIILFGMIVAVGISNLQYVDLNSSRNLFIIGFSFLMALAVPQWVKSNPGVIHTGSSTLDSVVTVLLSTNMFVGGIIGFVFDNTIPGTAEERGIAYWKKMREMQTSDSRSPELDRIMSLCYDLPGHKWLARWSITHYIPICPNFRRARVPASRTPCHDMDVDPLTEEASLSCKL